MEICISLIYRQLFSTAKTCGQWQNRLQGGAGEALCRKSAIFTKNMEKLLYTGLNDAEAIRFCGGKALAPYYCMGFSMLSVDTGNGYESVYEGDTIVRDADGTLRIERRSGNAE